MSINIVEAFATKNKCYQIGTPFNHAASCCTASAAHSQTRRRSGRHHRSGGNHLRGGSDHRQLLPPADQRLLPMLGQRVTDQVDRAGDVRRKKEG